MLTTVALSLALALQGQVPQEAPTAGAVISKMLAHYTGASSLVGQIRLTVTAMKVSSTLDTIVQFEKPSFVFVRQFAEATPTDVRLIVSDGKHFSYNMKPIFGSPKGDRLIEAVNQNGIIQTCQDIFGAGAQGLKDRNLPLDLAFGKRADLQYRRNQWATHEMLGHEQVGGVDTYVIGGDWREYATALVTGTYKMWITDAGDLLKYQETGLVLPNPEVAGQLGAQQVTSTWDVDLKIGAQTDHTLFTLQ